MVAVRAEVEIDTDIFEAYEKFFREAPDLFRRKVPSAARRVSRFARPRLQELTPPSPAPRYPGFPYPLRWKSAKQRRYVMAMLRKRGGPPYKRTGQLENAWGVETDIEADGGLFAIVNRSPIARFVYGPDQQPFHRDIGWPHLESKEMETALEPIREFAAEEIDNLWVTLIDPYLRQNA